MTSSVKHITVDCADPRALARFWAQVTGWPLTEEPAPGYPESAVGARDTDRPQLYFVQVPEGKTGKNRLHLDIEPADGTQDEEIARLLALGATVVSDNRPEYGWVILADPEGNEFCVELSPAEVAAAIAAEAAAAP